MSQSSPVWANVYESWRTLLLTLIRGYQTHGFEAWTIPCLYVVCKHLRLFAMKVDEERNNSGPLDESTTILQDDFDPDTHSQQKLYDCANDLNKVFSICQNDR